MSLVEMLCSCHESPRRAAARELERVSERPGQANRLADIAAGLVADGTLVVIVNDNRGISWQLLRPL